MAILGKRSFGDRAVGEEEMRARRAANLWVVGFDKVTGERSVFTVCPRASALFCAARYELDGYDVKILEGWEVDAMLDADRPVPAYC